MESDKNLQDVLRGLIDTTPVFATLFIVLFALAGIACCGYSALGMYRDNSAGAPFSLKWFVAFTCGFAMTIIAVVAARISMLFAD